MELYGTPAALLHQPGFSNRLRITQATARCPTFGSLRATPDQIAADLLAAMEIEVALDHVRSKLRSTPIPARAQRVYREVLAVLPPTLVEALDPITTLVAAHNLQ